MSAWRRLVRWLARHELRREYLLGHAHARDNAERWRLARRPASTGQASQDLIDQLRREGRL